MGTTETKGHPVERVNAQAREGGLRLRPSFSAVSTEKESTAVVEQAHQSRDVILHYQLKTDDESGVRSSTGRQKPTAPCLVQVEQLEI